MVEGNIKEVKTTKKDVPTKMEVEFEGIGRTHELDNAKFITFVKKVIKKKSMRVNTYKISEVSDGWMLKLTIEGFTTGDKSKYKKAGISMGTRVVKGYLSEEIKVELVKLLDAIPKHGYTDSRDRITKERPEKIISVQKTLDDLDLDKLFEI